MPEYEIPVRLLGRRSRYKAVVERRGSNRLGVFLVSFSAKGDLEAQRRLVKKVRRQSRRPFAGLHRVGLFRKQVPCRNLMDVLIRVFGGSEHKSLFA